MYSKYLGELEQLNEAKEYKYQPKTKKELQDLVYDESVDLSLIDTRLITDMSNLFNSVDRDITGIKNWDVSNVVNMNSTFYKCWFNDKTVDLSKWDTRKVKTMDQMFSRCDTRFKISGWNTQNVESMSYMLSFNTTFNSDLSILNVKKVKNFSGMFYNANINQKIIKSIADMWSLKGSINCEEMFKDYKGNISNIDFSKWDLSKGKSKNMFDGVKIDYSNYPKGIKV